MEFTINSKQKKVELFYESTEEQKAILELVSKWVIYKENYVSTSPTYRDITWTTGAAINAQDINNILTVKADGSIMPYETFSNSSSNISIKAEEDIPSNCIHVTAKSR